MSQKNKSIIGLILAALMLWALLNSAYFFLSVANFPLMDWLVFNACSLAIIAYLTCYTAYQITRKHLFLAIALVPQYYYGSMGLLVVPWDSFNAFAQITHIIITLNVIWVIFIMMKESKYEALGKGLLIGLLLFVPIFALIQGQTQLHMAEYLKMLHKTQ